MRPSDAHGFFRSGFAVSLACALAACGGDDDKRAGAQAPDGGTDSAVSPRQDAPSDTSAPGDAGVDGNADVSVDGEDAAADGGDASVNGDADPDAPAPDSGGSDAGATCPTSAGPAPTPNATSDQLIDQAEKAGRIDREQALIFKVFSVFGDLAGAPDAKFDLMKTMRARGLERLSVHYDYLKFTDDAVSYLRFENLFGPSFKIHALQKVGGTWRAVEDWSLVWFKELCRDKLDERLEELVLVYSNGIAERNAPPIPISMPATLHVSNVGCFRWRGTSSVTISSPEFIEESTANVVYGRVDHGSAYSTDPVIDFRPTSGTATYQIRPAPGALCRISTPHASAAIQPSHSLLLFPVPTPSAPAPGRLVNGNFEATATNIQTTRTMECEGQSLTHEWPATSAWLLFPDLGKASLSADGRTLSGSKTEILGGGVSYTTQWNFSAERE